MFMVCCAILFRKMEFNATLLNSEDFIAIKPGFVHHLLHKELPVPRLGYDSCFPFVTCACFFYRVLSFLNFTCSSVFLLFYVFLSMITVIQLFSYPKTQSLNVQMCDTRTPCMTQKQKTLFKSIVVHVLRLYYS